MSGKIRPISDKVVVKELPKDQMTPGGLHLPEAAQKQLPLGMVIAVGPGKYYPELCGYKEMEVEIDDVVVFREHSGVEVVIGTETFKILMEAEIVAVLEVNG